MSYVPLRFTLRSYGRRPWVARIVGLSDRYGLDRSFVRPFKDHRNRKVSIGGKARGTVLEWFLDEQGIFEIQDPEGARRFVRVVDGEIEDATKEEVIQWIRERSRSTSTS